MGQHRYFSRGKILMTGEYAVLYGAKALALPSHLGQFLQVSPDRDSGKLLVNSNINGKAWFAASFSLPDFEVISTTEGKVSDFVKEILSAANELKSGFFHESGGFRLESTLQFDTRWGLGSSSSLISNLAWWLDIDPYELLWKVSQGSGYDIACARSSNPLIYRLEGGIPFVQKVDFNPSFKDNLYFIYLGNKQDSQYSVRSFRNKTGTDKNVIREISGLTEAISRSTSLEEFEDLIRRHETCISNYLKCHTVKEDRFPGFTGTLKSLGAWGGDMILATWKESEEDLRKYFGSKGLKLIFRYEDLI